MIVNKSLYRISLNKARSWYNENMNLEMTIKKLGSAYKFRVGRATGNEHIFLFGLSYDSKLNRSKNLSFWGKIFKFSV